jgi:PAS domain S-box-containing protein
MMKDVSARTDVMAEEKALSTDQFLRYAKDVARLYETERAHRKALQSANRELAREIQERKQLQEELVRSEKKYRSLFEDSREAIYTTSHEGTLIDANDYFIRLLGYEKEEIVGSSILTMYADATERAAFQQLADRSDGVKDFEFKLRRKDGTVLDCMVTAAVSRRADGSVLGYQGIVRDVTEQKRSQQILELARRMEALAHMAGGIAHEIRNPLAVSSSAAQLLMNERLAFYVRKECVDKVLSGINRASLITENLLTFARPLTDYTVTTINLVELVVGTLRAVTSQAIVQNIQLVAQVEDECLLTVGNAEFLHKAFLNLFINGLAVMSGGGILSVAVAREDLIPFRNSASNLQIGEVRH